MHISTTAKSKNEVYPNCCSEIRHERAEGRKLEREVLKGRVHGQERTLG
jgi:hypothetical protein